MQKGRGPADVQGVREVWQRSEKDKITLPQFEELCVETKELYLSRFVLLSSGHLGLDLLDTLHARRHAKANHLRVLQYS